MKFEAEPVDDCYKCIFCYDSNWCRIADEEHCDFNYEHGRKIASFCPLINKKEFKCDLNIKALNEE